MPKKPRGKPLDERSYAEGNRQAWLGILAEAVSHLGGDDSDAVDSALLVWERQEVVAKLREVCAEFGDNDWTDDLSLADVIEKHLMRHLASP